MTPWLALATGGATLFLLLAVGLVVDTVLVALGSPRDDLALRVAVGLPVQCVSVALFCVGVAKWRGGVVQTLGLRMPKRGWLVLGVVPASLASDTLLAWLSEHAAWLDLGGLDLMAGAMALDDPWPMVVGASVVIGAPIYEELLFRGVMYEGIRRGRLGHWGAIVGTGLLFAGFHGDPLHIAGVLILGVYMSWVRWATGSLFTSMGAHFLNNLVWLAVVTLGWSWEVPLWVGGLSMVAVVAMMVAVRSSPKG
jgi:membrane protease YdiL (CAAX protease family)